ncbi:MAG: hypothetical protein E5W03_06195, partial [Mesorhizobium sp.]
VLPNHFLSFPFLGGVVLYGMAILAYAKALDTTDVSLAYPVMAGSGFAMITVASCFIFGEPFNLSKGIGIGFVMAGIISLSRGG